ncbi:MAG: hypothetical protein ACK4K0_01635 [Flavobacteriales bacterium]
MRNILFFILIILLSCSVQNRRTLQNTWPKCHIDKKTEKKIKSIINGDILFSNYRKKYLFHTVSNQKEYKLEQLFLMSNDKNWHIKIPIINISDSIYINTCKFNGNDRLDCRSLRDELTTHLANLDFKQEQKQIILHFFDVGVQLYPNYRISSIPLE